MLSLGSKSTAMTEPLLLQKQPNGARTPAQWAIIDKYKQEAEVLYRKLENAFNGYISFKASLSDILCYLEFKDPAYYRAFEVPDPEDSEEMVTVGKRGQRVSVTYLLSRWQRGQNAGIYERDICKSKSMTINKIWDMEHRTRHEHFQRWEDALMQESIKALVTVAREYNECQEDLMRAQNASLPGILHSKRIVRCTTTAAAKYGDEIRTFNVIFNPDVLLVERLAKFWSHILTALGPVTSQMISIGSQGGFSMLIPSTVLLTICILKTTPSQG